MTAKVVTIMLKVYFYTKDNCSLCEDAYALLMMFQNYYQFELVERDIYTNDEWLEYYQLLIPAVQIKDTLINCEQMSFEALENVLKEHAKTI